jgi:5-methylcytosine-specific restriction endonuclease McrA
MPLRPCNTCGVICEGGYCAKHPQSATRGGYRPARRSVRDRAYNRVWKALRLAVLNAAGWRCAYCGASATTGDHVVPRSRGGRTVLSNIVAACHWCNTSKGDRLLSEWIASGCAPEGAKELLKAREHTSFS